MKKVFEILWGIIGLFVVGYFIWYVFFAHFTEEYKPLTPKERKVFEQMEKYGDFQYQDTPACIGPPGCY